MAERAPTSAERAQWQKASDLADRVGRKIYANSARALNAEIIRKYGVQYMIVDLPQLPSNLTQRLQATAIEWKKIRRAMSYVESYDLGVQFQAGDINILAPASYTKEQIQALNLSGWFIPIAVGAVIFAGIIARLVYLEDENDELEAQLNTTIAASEKRICQNPNSAECKNWKVETEKTDYSKNVSLIDEIKNSLSAVGESAKSGIGWGAMIIVIAIGFSIFFKGQNR